MRLFENFLHPKMSRKFLSTMNDRKFGRASFVNFIFLNQHQYIGRKVG